MDKIQVLLQSSKVLVFGANAEQKKSLLTQLHLSENSSALLFLENKDKFPSSIHSRRNIFVLALGNDKTSAAELAQALSREQISSAQIVFLEKLPADTGMLLVKTWDKQLLEILETELQIAQASGALALLENANGEKMQSAVESARLTFTLAVYMSSDLDFIERVVRLALFFSLTKINGWQEVVRASRRLWCLLPLLEQKKDSNEAFATETSLELVIVHCAYLALQKEYRELQGFRHAIKKMTAHLPFQLRTQVRIGVDRSFKQLWENQDEVA